MMTNNRRFVFDTNELISAFLFNQSKPRQALDQAQNIGVIVLSNSVLSELKEVLYRPKFDKYLSLARRQEFLENLTENAQFIKPSLINGINNMGDTNRVGKYVKQDIGI